MFAGMRPGKMMNDLRVRIARRMSRKLAAWQYMESCGTLWLGRIIANGDEEHPIGA